MHILILPSWYPDTPSDVKGVFFRDQALALRNAGHKVGVVAPELRSLRTVFRNQSWGFAPHYELDEGIATFRKPLLAGLPRVPYGNYLLFRRVASKLVSDYIHEHGKPDIIHGHVGIFAGAAAVDIGRKWGIPVVITEHSTGYAREVYAKWQLKLSERAFRQADSCIAVSPALASLLEELLPATRGFWSWIPNVVANRFRLPETFIQDPRPFRFLNLALMSEKKGQLDLIDAFDQLISEGFPAELWLAGDGPIREHLEAEALRRGLSDKIYFPGLVAPDKVPKMLETVDVMVIASHYETFGVVAAEALMAGLPVIATQCGGPECIVSQGDGLLVPPRDPHSLAAAMRQVGENLRSYDRHAIAERAKERFSGPAIAERLTAIYESVVVR